MLEAFNNGLLMKAVVHQSGYTLKPPGKLKNSNNNNNKQMKTN